jgi:putative transposase
VLVFWYIVLVWKGGILMAKRIAVEKAIRILREVEVLQGQGSTIGEACRKLGVSEYTYYRWKKEYGRLDVDQAKRLKELERENGRLKKLVADLSLDNAILREAASGNS